VLVAARHGPHAREGPLEEGPRDPPRRGRAREASAVLGAVAPDRLAQAVVPGVEPLHFPPQGPGRLGHAPHVLLVFLRPAALVLGGAFPGRFRTGAFLADGGRDRRRGRNPVAIVTGRNRFGPHLAHFVAERSLLRVSAGPGCEPPLDLGQ